jgi:hypothetical protein
MHTNNAGVQLAGLSALRSLSLSTGGVAAVHSANVTVTGTVKSAVSYLVRSSERWGEHDCTAHVSVMSLLVLLASDDADLYQMCKDGSGNSGGSSGASSSSGSSSSATMREGSGTAREQRSHDYHMQVVTAGGASQAVASVGKFSLDEPLQRLGLQVLSQLVRSSDGAYAVLEVRGVEVINAAMKAMADSEAVQVMQLLLMMQVLQAMQLLLLAMQVLRAMPMCYVFPYCCLCIPH